MGCLLIRVQLNGYWIQLVIALAVRLARRRRMACCAAGRWVGCRARGGLGRPCSSQRQAREPLLLSRARVHGMAWQGMAGSLRSAPVLRYVKGGRAGMHEHQCSRDTDQSGYAHEQLIL